MKKLLSIRSVGASYPSSGGRRGWHRSAGFNHAFIEGEKYPRYFSEDESWSSISGKLKAEGVDTAEFDKGLDNWVKTGRWSI